MGIGAGQNHRLTAAAKPCRPPGHHKSHQVGKRSPTGCHTATAGWKAEPLGHPATQPSFQVGEAGRELLGEQIVVQAGADQLSGDGRRERRGIQMGQRAGMVGIEGAIHHQLQIGQQPISAHPGCLKLHFGQHAQGRQR
jgi:hypothetical protein